MKLEHSSSLAFADPEAVKNIVADAISMALDKGASHAEAGLSVSQGLSVATRLGSVETIEHQLDNGLGISVYFGKHKASASTSNLDPDAIRKTVEAACDISRYTSEDSCAGLAEAELMAREFRELDLFHPWELEPQAVIELALECENAALGHDPRIVNSEGASVDTNAGVAVYGNSHGFLQAQYKTRHAISCAVVGESNGNMQRDYWYDISRKPDQLQSACSVGRTAAERTIRRLDATKIKTRQAPVMYLPELARGLIGHFNSAISGAAQYRKASFLFGAVGERVFPEFLQLHEDPFIPQALASANYDAEGVATAAGALVADGVIQHYLLDSYSARKLELETTGHAGGVHNLIVSDTGKTFDECLAAMHSGLLVTELMGHGVNNVTGDYSRGAAGFWVENGKIDHPVEEVTIASNLRDMFGGIVEIGNDLDLRGNIRCGSMLIERMMIAGSD